MSTRTYRVTYRVNGTPDPRGAAITRHRPHQNDDGSFTWSVSITDGYSTLEDVPRILAIAHPSGTVRPEQVEVVSTSLLVYRCPECGRSWTVDDDAQEWAYGHDCE